MTLECMPLSPLFYVRFQASDWSTQLYGLGYISTRWFGMLLQRYSVFSGVFLWTLFFKRRRKTPFIKIHKYVWTRPYLRLSKWLTALVVRNTYWNTSKHSDGLLCNVFADVSVLKNVLFHDLIRTILRKFSSWVVIWLQCKENRFASNFQFSFK